MTTRPCRAAARIFLALLLSLFLRPLSFAEEKPALTPNPSPAASYDAEAMRRWSLHEMMVKLCEDHVIWLRSLIVSAAADLPDKDLVRERLQRNHRDIAIIFRAFYGVDASDKLNELLNDHIAIFGDVLAAAKTADAAKQHEAAARWNKNADDIAAFLNQANPKNWSVNDMRKMLHEHLQLINEVVELRAGGHYADDIAHYDKVQRQMLKIAHVLSAGMTNQFPDKARLRP